ncbi:MAG: SCO family protein [Bryobacterales bacterium]|nr:SCO family protein [Bryobacterales bacterium]
MKPAFAGATALLVSLSCSAPPPLPMLGQIPAFALTAQTGQPFQSESLDGKIWVADFIYSTCTGPCPRMSSLMRQVQAAVSTYGDAVKLVSFTVDPERDTAVILAQYAERYHAQDGRWFFLTGERETLHRLKREAFKLGDVDGSLNHSTRLVLIDRRGRIRGYYGTTDESPVVQIVRGIKQLRKEAS